MRKSAKVAISLSPKLLRDIEHARQASGESRSEFLRHAAEAHLRHQRERTAIQQYLRGYQQHPETAAELALGESTALLALAESPWDATAER